MKIINLDDIRNTSNPSQIINKLGIDYQTHTSARDADLAQKFCDFMIGTARSQIHAIGYLGSTLRGTSYEIDSDLARVSSDIDIVIFTGNEPNRETKLTNIREILKKEKQFQDEHNVELDIQIKDLDLIIEAIEKSSLATVFLQATIEESKLFGQTAFFNSVCDRLSFLLKSNERLHTFNQLYREAGNDYGLIRQIISRQMSNAIFLPDLVIEDENGYCDRLFKTREI